MVRAEWFKVAACVCVCVFPNATDVWKGVGGPQLLDAIVSVIIVTLTGLFVVSH